MFDKFNLGPAFLPCCCFLSSSRAGICSTTSPIPGRAIPAAVAAITSNRCLKRRHNYGMRLVLFLLCHVLCWRLPGRWSRSCCNSTGNISSSSPGYYAAIEQGYFRDAGFAVTPARVAGGGRSGRSRPRWRSRFRGGGFPNWRLHRAQGKPVVALAAIVQHSPLILLVNRRKVSVIDSLQAVASCSRRMKPNCSPTCGARTSSRRPCRTASTPRI